MTFSCIIVEDEPLSHKVLKNHIQKINNLNLVGSFFNTKDAEDYLRDNTVAILFLDIQMPEVTGLEFLRSLTVKPVTIISTAFRDYALEGFDLGVIDYLLKPIHFERFEIAVKRATDFLQLVRSGDTVNFKRLEDHAENFEILIKTGTRKILLDYRKILFAQGLKDYTILHTEDKKFVVKGSVKAFEDYLPKDHFMRVHKSFIVSKSKIKLVYKNKIEFDAISVPIGRSYKEAVNKFLSEKRPLLAP